LAQVIIRCLQASPEHRIGSAREALGILVERRRRWPMVAGALGVLAVAGAVGTFAWSRLHHAAPVDDGRKRELFSLSQRGEHKKAELLWQQYVTDHPDDREARMMLALTSWWVNGILSDPSPELAAKLDPVHRDMLHGIALMTWRRESEAIAFLEDVAQHHKRAEVEYALGEVRWHGQQIERGVQTLESAYAMDNRWQLALHHVIEYRLARGETKQLSPYVGTLQAQDPAGAATLTCEIAAAEGRYDSAIAAARSSIAAVPPSNELYGCLLDAQLVSGDYDGAAATAEEASSKASIDLREEGVRTLAASIPLYRGKLSEYLATLPDSADRQRRIVLALWKPTEDLVEPLADAKGPRGQPIVPASGILVAHMLGRDAKALYEGAAEAELRAFGRGLALKLQGDLAGAAVELRRAVNVPAKGDVRLLAAHALASVLVAQGDHAGAKAACDEILRPHHDQPYRVALFPDCVLWSDDPQRWKQLAAQWTGDFEHPSVVEIKRRLAAIEAGPR
jgi:tetratricopeptide (TPR) repeat protein